MLFSGKNEVRMATRGTHTQCHLWQAAGETVSKVKQIPELQVKT